MEVVGTKKKEQCDFIVKITNPSDRLCLGRAITTGTAHHETVGGALNGVISVQEDLGSGILVENFM